MNSFLMINSLFKTIEYKLVDSSKLEITELSISGKASSKTFSLNSLNIEEGQSTSSSLPWLVLFLGSVSIAAVIYFSKESTLISHNLLSAVSFLICAFGALALICKPAKTHIYRDSFSNHLLFELNELSTEKNTTNLFIKDLNSAINSAKDEDNNLRPKVLSEFEKHTNNINELLNSGLIDESLYNRVCESMHNKVFGDENKELTNSNNVIYLNL